MLSTKTIKINIGTLLVVQWLRIHLAMQGTQVQPLVRKLRPHIPGNSQARAPQLLSLHSAACVDTIQEFVRHNKSSM